MAKRKHRMWLLVPIGCVAVALAVGLIAARPFGTPLNWFVRGVALLGYQAIFLATISSAYLKQVVRFFGRPFIKVHHAFSVAGLILITLHPVSAAIQASDWLYFLPRFDSLLAFLQWGGRLAWYLLMAAALRWPGGRAWRAIHLLNYVAFLLGTIHPFLLGTDFQGVFTRAILVVLALVVLVSALHGRLFRARRKGS